MNNKKRILVRLERLTIFMVEQENSLENAVSYYLGGVPPAVLPPRWVQPAVRGGGTVHIFLSSVPGSGPGPFSAKSRDVGALLKLQGGTFLFLPMVMGLSMGCLHLW